MVTFNGITNYPFKVEVDKREEYRKVIAPSAVEKNRELGWTYKPELVFRRWSKARWTIYENEQKWGKDDGLFKWQHLNWQGWW